MAIHPGADLSQIEADLTSIQTDLTSIEAEIEEVEHHLHNWERWFGLSGSPSGETHRAQRIGITTTPFQVDAGNNTWSSWLQILGSSDTPADTGKLFFDLHRLMIVAVENANNVHFIQIGLGSSGAAALSAGTYSELVFQPQSVQGQQTILDVLVDRVAVTTKTWLRLWVVGQNTSTMDFFFGLHEYDA